MIARLNIFRKIWGVLEHDAHQFWKLKFIWTASSEFDAYRLCEQRRFRRACAFKICDDGMLEDTKSLDAAHLLALYLAPSWCALTMHRSFEPRQANLCLRAFRHDKF